MAVIWGLPDWVWIAVAGIAFATCLLIARVLAAVFASLRDLTDSLALSQRMLDSALEETRREVAKVQEGMARLGGEHETQPRPAWGEW